MLTGYATHVSVSKTQEREERTFCYLRIKNLTLALGTKNLSSCLCHNLMMGVSLTTFGGNGLREFNAFVLARDGGIGRGKDRT